MRRERTLHDHLWYRRLAAGALAVAYLALGAAVASGEPGAQDTTPAAGNPAAEAPKPNPAAPEDAGANLAQAPAPPAGEAPAPPVAPPAGETPAPPVAPPAPGKVMTAPLGEGKIELHIKDEELANVLELLSVQYKLNLVVSKSAKGRVSADLYNVTVDQALDAITRAAGLTWVREGDCIYIQTAEEMAAVKGADSRMTTRVFRLNYLKSEEAVKIIAPVLSTKATTAATTAAETGISAEGGKTGGNTLGVLDTIVVRDFPENLKQVAEILKEMDHRPRQVLIEATILRVTLDDETSLGVNFNALAGVDFRDLNALATPAPASAETAPATVVTNASQTARANQHAWSQGNTQGFATRGTGLNVGVVTNNISVFVHALEEAHDTTVLSNPKVLALNKQSAEVNVGDQIGYRGAVTQTETANTQDVQFMDVGTRLAFRPYISDDGYIRLEIHPEVSQRGLETLDGVPSKSTVEVTCNVIVKDGHTIVVGGLFEEIADINRQQIPGLGNLPLLGPLFRLKTDGTTRSEIIILLTPHIIDDAEAADVIGREVMANGRRHCLGMREGFACFTRERMTVGHMDEADRAWRDYERTRSPKDLDRARWNVGLALNVAPNNIKAMRLRDRILSEKNGAPYSPPSWTIWDSLHDRLEDLFGPKSHEGETKAAPSAASQAGPPPPSTPAAATEAASDPASGPVAKEVNDAS